jgi:hypothetical protein
MELILQVAAHALASPFTHMRGVGGSVSPATSTAANQHGNE